MSALDRLAHIHHGTAEAAAHAAWLADVPMSWLVVEALV